MKVHRLKTWPGYFQDVIDGRKSFEVRFDDRGFALENILILEEYDQKQQRYTGRVTWVKVKRIWRDLPGMKEGYVLMEF